MCILKKLFSKNARETSASAGASEPLFNTRGTSHAADSYKNTDPLTGKKKKKLMDPVLGHIAGNPQDSNSIKKSGV